MTKYTNSQEQTLEQARKQVAKQEEYYGLLLMIGLVGIGIMAQVKSISTPLFAVLLVVGGCALWGGVGLLLINRRMRRTPALQTHPRKLVASREQGVRIFKVASLLFVPVWLSIGLLIRYFGFKNSTMLMWQQLLLAMGIGLPITISVCIRVAVFLQNHKTKTVRNSV